VKHLPAEITYKQFYDEFAKQGRILSCKISFDANRKCNGYGFVHYHNAADADKCVQQMNGARPFPQAQDSLIVCKFERRDRNLASTYTNLYITHLPNDFTSDNLQATFAKYDMVNCQIREGRDAKSACVSFKTHEQATQVEKDIGNIIQGAKAVRFQNKAERQRSRLVLHHQCKNRNLYVKNLDNDVTDADLYQTFASHGKITSAVVMKDKTTGTSRGFGFVCFENEEDAKKVLETLQGEMVGLKPMHLAFAQTKAERRSFLAQKHQGGGGGSGYQMPAVWTGLPAPQPFQQYIIAHPPYPGDQYQYQQAPSMQYQMLPKPLPRQTRGGPAMGGRGVGRGGPPHMVNKPLEVQKQPPVVQRPIIPQQPRKIDGQLTDEERRHALGEQLFPAVKGGIQQLNPGRVAEAAKITGMLLEMEIIELTRLTQSPAELMSKIHEAFQVLDAHREGRS
jgi:polyadenylate-binding protein